MTNLSNCCQASMHVEGNTTNYYVCDHCHQVCDPFVESWGEDGMNYQERLEEILTRLLADVDDSMEFLNTPFNPKDRAASKVSRSIGKALSAINALNKEMIGEDYPTPPLGDFWNGGQNDLRADLRQRFGVEG